MRGFEDRSDALFVYVSPETFVPKDHPLRPLAASGHSEQQHRPVFLFAHHAVTSR